MEKFQDVLLAVGTIVKADMGNGDAKVAMIVGKRVVNPRTKNRWDYIAVPFPEGAPTDDDYYFFDHTCIYEMMVKAPVLPAQEESE